MQIKISCIIPVYKVEAYLRQCVESLTYQTYRNLEIILVDDGSPDGSPQLCDSMAGEDSRIRVIHKENGGLSDARNTGLLASTGDYVVFIDGDDFWRTKEAMQRLVDAIKPELDFVGFNCAYYYPSSQTFTAWVPYDVSLSKPTDKNSAIIALVKSGTFPMSACMKLMKREFLIKNELFFEKGLIAEDIPWFINVLDKCNKCSFVNQYIYAYRQNREGSITNVSGDKSFRSLRYIVESETEKVENRRFNKEAKEALYSFFAYELSILLTYSNIDKDTYKKLKSYSWLINYDMNPKVKIVKMVKNILGLNLTVKLLKLYQNKRKNKK